jgi:hypothetical protein
MLRDKGMDKGTVPERDSLDWPLIVTAGSVALLTRLAILRELIPLVLMLLIPTAMVATWAVARFVFAASSKNVYGITSAVVAALFAYFSAQWILPSRDAIKHSAENFRFEGERSTYEASVENHKLADPHRTFIVFEAKGERRPGEVDQRIAYDETDALMRGTANEVDELVIQQSVGDAAKFASCRWTARHIDAHFYALDFYC